MRYRRTHKIAVEGCLCLCRSWHSSSKWRRRNTVNSESLSRCPSDLIALSLFLWSAQHSRHNSFAFDRIMTVLLRLTHRYDTVPAILSHLETIGCASLTNPVSQLVLLRIYSRAGMYAMLLEAYHHLQASYAFVPDTFARNLVMDALFRVGHSHLALTLTLSLFSHTHPPNFFTFHILLLHLSKLNNNNLNLYLPHIARILRLMLWAGYSPSPLTFQMLLNSLCKINAFPQAYQLLALMTALGINFSVNIWTILIHNYCKFGRLRLANNLFHNMLQTGCSPNVVTYTILFKAFMQSNMPTPAFRLFNVMLSSGQSPDLILCNVLIDCLSKAGRCQDAIQVFLSLSERNLKPDSYTFASLLSTICRSRMFYLLPKLVLVSRHVDADLVFCNALLSSLTKADLPSLAVGFYDHMIDEGFVPDKYTFAGLLSALCCAGRVDKAVNVYHGVVMSYHDTDAHIHTVIIVGLLKTGKFHKAVSVLRFAVMNKYPLDTVAYTVGICALLRGRRTQEACTLYDQMKNNGLKPSVHTYNMMLFTFCKERDLQMIKQILQEMIDSRIYLSGRNFSNLCVR
ncbi:putative pentatricopeptide repeat-containing protein [Glycine max]|nr:putative pentatricopeptide repeat-containing protein [Glycine max]